jgi:hypothetical protein
VVDTATTLACMVFAPEEQLSDAICRVLDARDRGEITEKQEQGLLRCISRRLGEPVQRCEAYLCEGDAHWLRCAGEAAVRFPARVARNSWRGLGSANWEPGYLCFDCLKARGVRQ